ncbi:4Fe-4S binding protein [Tamlana fucoidanivorans]|uniref:4Fe-4S dicluster domain-containing protein n=1 Tax=Allotamlana fucoidanivorans TaxID=2583814 RepID=A0A5C4SDB1_9FLAO|nr:4Fe-4S binding protein [Tamlana fucoidanivorans]TNJ41471.1 4Fe-4S dicluster domain-containing protein [Tamlana fucoidanivorans]
MKTSTSSILTANEAVAQIAYKTNEVFPIYPITPASDMSELIEQWHAENIPNSFGNSTSVFQMQSESGVAGAMHGALQTGTLSTTFTASQGLLLMLPNMYKIAGELMPNVIHVATRSIATHALSVFGDHSDVMAVRQSGYAMLSSASVQEAHDLALIAQAASLQAQIPFIHFFDGFRTSHEYSKINVINDHIIQTLINQNDIKHFKSRALNPNSPTIKGTAQGPDVFFQSREAINSFYDACPDIVTHKMHEFGTLTGRFYQPFDYYGHPKAKHIIVAMASSTDTIETTINQLNKEGKQYGLIKVRLFRPFSIKHLLKVLPKSVTSVAVLDRTKEPGSTGEPLYLDIIQAIATAHQNKEIHRLPNIIGGRYGLSSKEFTPAMVKAVFNNLEQKRPKNHFTVGINDNVTHLSLPFSDEFEVADYEFQAIFYQEKSTEITTSFINTLKRIGCEQNIQVQAYTACDYKKSNTLQLTHLRVDSRDIKAPYLIERANFIGCQNPENKHIEHAVNHLKPKGTLLISTSKTSKAIWQSLSNSIQKQIKDKNMELFVVNIEEIKLHNFNLIDGISEFHACFLALNKRFCKDEDMKVLSEFIYKVDTSKPSQEFEKVNHFDAAFLNSLLGQLLQQKGNDVPVSLLPTDGTYPSNTSIYSPAINTPYTPEWDTDLCTQCGLCSMVCPQGALRIKVFDDSTKLKTPKAFKQIPSIDFDTMNYALNIHPDQCNACNHCVDACEPHALKLVPQHTKTLKEHWDAFEAIPEFDRTKIDNNKMSQQQLQEPLFKYSTGVKGCGEAPYLKLISQLYGDRLLIANATGASSIFGGALPTTPWSKNRDGLGPAWSNSLFEDNAELGLGFRMSLNQQEKQAKNLLEKLNLPLHHDLIYAIIHAKQSDEFEINEQRKRITKLKNILKKESSTTAKKLLHTVDSLVKKSVWIVGGDGWAYDIGYGGIDHVLASGENVNILVLDNEVYDNTGAQASKSTPFGASSKFAFNGKQKQKKDLGRLAMTYDNIYVASVAMGANPEQTLKAFTEAESFDGPSIIIAYCHSQAHGIDMTQPSLYHKGVVHSGLWLLYRREPRKQNSFVLDSKAPSITIEDYLKHEQRFYKFYNNTSGWQKTDTTQLQKQIIMRFNKYMSFTLNTHLI